MESEQRLSIRPQFGESSLDNPVVSGALISIGLLVWVVCLSLSPSVDKTRWGSGLLVLLLFATLPIIFTAAIALTYFARLEIDQETLIFHGPQIKTEQVKVRDIKRVNAILLHDARRGDILYLEVVGPAGQRFRLPIQMYRPQDISLVLQRIKAQVPTALFDERADLLVQNKPLP